MKDAFEDVYKLFRKEMGSQLATRLHKKYAPPSPAPAQNPDPEAKAETPEFSAEDLSALDSDYSNVPE